MSDYLDPEEREPVDGSRRRALWGLVVLGCVAVIIGSLMVLLGGGSGNKNNNTGLDQPPLTSPPTTVIKSTPTHRATTKAIVPTKPAPKPSPPRTGNPCAGAATCGVSGDGGVVTALNAYRTEHGEKTVSGAATARAETCALHQGAAKYCAQHWIYTTSPSQSGTDCIKGFAGFNPSWLLDKQMTSFSVGWAYVAGTYQCAVAKTLSTD
ncbi:MAG: hypothetical protein ABI301_01990 [Jatrophihabitantaceae bacterium]